MGIFVKFRIGCLQRGPRFFCALICSKEDSGYQETLYNTLLKLFYTFIGLTA